MDFSSSKFNEESESQNNDVILPSFVCRFVFENKALVQFCAFLYATFNFEYDFLDTLTTLDAKVLEYSPEGNL